MIYRFLTFYVLRIGVPHHLLGTVSPNVEFTVKDFRDAAIPVSPFIIVMALVFLFLLSIVFWLKFVEIKFFFFNIILTSSSCVFIHLTIQYLVVEVTNYISCWIFS